MYLAKLRKELARPLSILCPREPALVSRLVSLGPSSWVAGGCSLEPQRVPGGRRRRSPLAQWVSGQLLGSFTVSGVGLGQWCLWLGLAPLLPQEHLLSFWQRRHAEQLLSLLPAPGPWPVCSEAHLKLLSPFRHVITRTSADLWG